MPSTSEEQLLLELVNAARLDPLGNAALYISSYTPALTSPDADIQLALNYFGVSGLMLLQQFQALSPAQPLAWNDTLQSTATAHSQAMLTAGVQSHQVSGEADLGTRVSLAGYSYQTLGENIFAYATSALDAHAAFMVDWGGSAATGGMQSPPGHRNNIMNAAFREIGIGIIDSSANGLGPVVVTEDLGSRGANGVFILGVAYDDADHNKFYSIGEGRSGLTVAVGAAAAASSASGGYSLALAAFGQQAITLSGADLSSPVQVVANLANGSNYKLDVIDGHILHTSVSGVITGGVDTVVGLGLTGLSLTTGAGSQTLTGTPGNDALNGGAGRDTVILTGARANYTVTRSGATVTVAGASDGTDTLTSIEALAFSDRTVSLTTNRSDFNGDGVSDNLFRNNSTGDTGFYQLTSGGSLQGWRSLGASSTSYAIVGTGDFTGLGHADVLFRNNATGDTGFYKLDASGALQGWVDIGPSSIAYSVVGVGDFNADGLSDILYRNNATGDTGFYQLNSNGSFNSWHWIGGSSATYAVAGVGDFNGDGVSDVLFQNASSGDTGFYQLNSDGGLNSWKGIAIASTAYTLVGTGDFNGDGVSDVLFRNNAGGDVGFYQMNPGGTFQGWHDIGASSTAYSVAAIGDYNGDGVSDVLFRSAATGDTGFYQLNADGTYQGWHSVGASSTAYSIIG